MFATPFGNPWVLNLQLDFSIKHWILFISFIKIRPKMLKHVLHGFPVRQFVGLCRLLHFFRSSSTGNVRSFDISICSLMTFIPGHFRIVNLHVHCSDCAKPYFLNVRTNRESFCWGFIPCDLRFVLVSTEAQRSTENRFVHVDAVTEGHWTEGGWFLDLVRVVHECELI